MKGSRSGNLIYAIFAKTRNKTLLNKQYPLKLTITSFSPWSTLGFLQLCALTFGVDISFMRDNPAHCRMWNSISCFYPLDASSIPQVVTTEISPDATKNPLGGQNHPQLRASTLITQVATFMEAFGHFRDMDSTRPQLNLSARLLPTGTPPVPSSAPHVNEDPT